MPPVSRTTVLAVTALVSTLAVPHALAAPVFVTARDEGNVLPLFGKEPLTVQATKRAVTVDEVIAATGARTPAATAAPKQFTLGVLLLVGADESDAEVAAHQAVMEPIAAELAPSFAEATGNKGTLEVVSVPPQPDMAASIDAGAVPDEGGGCSVAGAHAPLPWIALALLGVCVVARRRRA